MDLNISEERLKILAVDDDRITLKFVQACLSKEKTYKVTPAADGQTAMSIIQSDPPDIVVTDWMMPELDGLELCRKIRTAGTSDYIYLILLTARNDYEDIVAGLAAGADDYIVKPFDHGELMARVRAGARVVRGQKALRRTNRELQNALAQIKTLKGLLPICMDCKKIRDDKDYWREIEDYLEQMTDTEFSHGLCPDCMKKRIKDFDDPI